MFYYCRTSSYFNNLCLYAAKKHAFTCSLIRNVRVVYTQFLLSSVPLGAGAHWGYGRILDTCLYKVSIMCPKYVHTPKFVQIVPKICPILLNMSKKNVQSFAMFSALAKYAHNMSILCPNFGHYLDTFSLIFLSWKCPKFWAYFGHQKSRLKNMCKLHKSVQNMSKLWTYYGHIYPTTRTTQAPTRIWQDIHPPLACSLNAHCLSISGGDQFQMDFVFTSILTFTFRLVGRQGQ